MIRDKLRTHLVSLKSGTRGIIKNRPKAEVQILIPSKTEVFGPPQAEFLGGLKIRRTILKNPLFVPNLEQGVLEYP